MTCVAIDFGTSNTVICIWDPDWDAPRTVPLKPISRQFGGPAESVDVIPSVAFVQSSSQIVIGEDVRSRRLGTVHPDRLFQGFKRDLVADYVPPPRYLDGQAYDPETIAGLFLSQLQHALAAEGLEPTQLVMTVPVGSFEQYVSWIRQTAATLNWPSVQVVDESTAAALGYAVTHPGSVVLVIDFGGGTLDLSLVRIQALLPGETTLKAEVIAKSDAYVGGIDIDTWIVEDYLRSIGSSRATLGALAWQSLLDLAERLKISVSTQETAVEVWFDDETFTAHEMTLSREQLEDILETQQLLDQVRQALDDVVIMAQSKGILKTDIDQVLLVGGSCQISAIQDLARSYFGRKRVKADRPFDAVAQGALYLGRTVIVDDYLRHTYAIRLWDPHTQQYSYYPLFEKGSRYPCVREDPLVLQVAMDGQTEIRLDIGEVADDVHAAEVTYDEFGRMTSRRLLRQSDFRALSGTTDPICVAHLDPVGKAGFDRIRVQFRVNEQRILLASVEDLSVQRILVEQTPVAKLQ